MTTKEGTRSTLRLRRFIPLVETGIDSLQLDETCPTNENDAACDLNMITISGYRAHDPKCSYRHSAIAVTSFRMAVPQDVKNGKCELSMWLTVKLFGAAAELAAQDLTKGDGISATGTVAFETSINKDGTSRSACVILADSFNKDCASSRTQTRDRAAQSVTHAAVARLACENREVANFCT